MESADEPARKRSHKKPVFDSSPINNLDDGCLMHIFGFLSPISDRYNAALVCRKWCYLACHPRLWLRVDWRAKDSSLDLGVFLNIESAVSAARPGDTILIAPGGDYDVSSIQIKKPLCLVGGGELPDETSLVCSRGSDSALEFHSTCKVMNLTVKAELGFCLVHRSGRLTIDSCVLQCEPDPLDFLSFPIVCMATAHDMLKHFQDSISVSQTRIEGGAKAVLITGSLVLQHVRVVYTRRSLFFWFDVGHR